MNKFVKMNRERKLNLTEIHVEVKTKDTSL